MIRRDPRDRTRQGHRVFRCVPFFSLGSYHCKVKTRIALLSKPPKKKEKKAEEKAETPTAASICKEKKRKEKKSYFWFGPLILPLP